MTVTAVNGLLRSRGQWINSAPIARSLRILILNLMPNKAETERQFLNRFAAGTTDVAVTFMYPSSHHFKSLPAEVIAQNYVTLAAIKNQYFDGLIITGAPVETLPFANVDYWDELLAIIAWAQQHVHQTLFECWAAQAGLYAQFDIEKQHLVHKIFGIYAATSVDSRALIMDGLSAGGLLKMPQSRHTELVLPADLPRGLHVVAANEQIGPLILTAPTQRAVYVTGHPEYGRQTLADEYDRDRRRGLPIQLPEHYFEHGESAEIDYSWRAASCRLYQNWFATLSLTKVGL
ncbi:homoserine O-acetyltransferase/O-succinyltransferase family protein [Lactiplantibacillus herbarum]|uniref:homoserine O-acetyltransferase/O-succinyltransferase family protein n=1 Tax=Lactiplantibacillus herbarum TaxID=1670446 RepID=UPI00064E47E9|nr:homoserine O-succinyltransferase [Lactiplantibacillus herbarum]